MPRWRGVELPRLLDARHAALVEQVVARLSALGWETVLEYTFQHFGERGSVDVLAWRSDSRALIVVEVKTDLDDLQEMLSAVDRKARLVPRLVAAERSWAALVLGVVLVMPEGSTSRWQVSGTRPSSRQRSPHGTTRSGVGLGHRPWPGHCAVSGFSNRMARPLV